MRVRRALTMTSRQPRSGSQTTNRLHTPRRSYSSSCRAGRPGATGTGRGHLPEQLAAGLVQADLRMARVVGTGIDLQHVLHPPAELGVLLRRDAPALGQPRLEAVCFKAWRTVSYDTDSTSSSSTSRSAS